MTHKEALQKLSPEHRDVIQRMISEKVRPLNPHEKDALNEFIAFLRMEEK